MSFSSEQREFVISGQYKSSCCRRAILLGAMAAKGSAENNTVTLSLEKAEVAELISRFVTEFYGKGSEILTPSSGGRRVALKFESASAAKYIANIDENTIFTQKCDLCLSSFLSNDVTNFNVAVVFEMLGHKDEVVTYEKMPMSEWTTRNGDWIEEANKDIVYPGQEPTYKYQASHFAGANRDLKNAGDDFGKIGEILSRTIIYLTDYDKKNSTVVEQVEQYMQYVKRYNYEVEKMNAAFMDVYLGVVPANPVAAITSAS